MKYQEIFENYHIITKLNRNNMPVLFCRKKDDNSVLFLTEKNMEYVPVPQDIFDELQKTYSPKATSVFPITYSNKFDKNVHYTTLKPTIETCIHIIKSFVKGIFPNSYQQYFERIDKLSFQTYKENSSTAVSSDAVAYYDQSNNEPKIVLIKTPTDHTEAAMILIHELLHAITAPTGDKIGTGFIDCHISYDLKTTEMICFTHQHTGINEGYTQYLAEKLVKSAIKKNILKQPEKNIFFTNYDLIQNMLEITLSFANNTQKEIIRKAYFLNDPQTLKQTLSQILSLENQEKIEVLSHQMDALVNIYKNSSNLSIEIKRDDIKRITTSIMYTFLEVCHPKIQEISKSDPTKPFSQILDFDRINKNVYLMKLINQENIMSLNFNANLSQNFHIDTNSKQLADYIIKLQNHAIDNNSFQIQEEFLNPIFFTYLLGQNAHRAQVGKVFMPNDYTNMAKNIFDSKNMFLPLDLEKKYKFLQDIFDNSSLFSFDIISCMDITSLSGLCLKNPKNLHKLVSINEKKAQAVMKTLPADDFFIKGFISMIITPENELNSLQKMEIINAYISAIPKEKLQDHDIKLYLSDVIFNQISSLQEDLSK